MEETNDSKTAAENRSNLLFFVLPLVAAVIYYFSNPKPQDFYNYTFLVAGNLLHGATGLGETPPTWLNEFVPFLRNLVALKSSSLEIENGSNQRPHGQLSALRNA